MPKFLNMTVQCDHFGCQNKLDYQLDVDYRDHISVGTDCDNKLEIRLADPPWDLGWKSVKPYWANRREYFCPEHAPKDKGKK